MVRLRAVVVVMLCLVFTPETEVVAMGMMIKSDTTTTNSTAGQLKDPLVDTDLDKSNFKEDNYGFQAGYGILSRKLIYLIPVAAFFFLTGISRIEDPCGEPTYGHGVFESYRWTYPKQDGPEFRTVTPVLLELPDAAGAYTTLRVYNEETRAQSGMIAFLLDDFSGVNGIFASNQQVEPGDLIVAVECKEFDEDFADTNGWIDSSFQEWIETDVMKRPESSAKLWTSVDLMLFHMNGDKFKWCPHADTLHVTPASTPCKNKWPGHVLGQRPSIQAWVDHWRSQQSEAVPELEHSQEGRQQLHLEKTKKKLTDAQNWMFWGACLTVMVWSYICTYGTLTTVIQREEVHRSLFEPDMAKDPPTPPPLGLHIPEKFLDFYGWMMKYQSAIHARTGKDFAPKSFQESPMEWINHKIFDQVGIWAFIPVALLVFVTFVTTMLEVSMIKGKKHVNSARLEVTRITVQIMTCSLLPLMMFVTGKGVTWQNGKYATATDMALNWMAFFLSGIFFSAKLTEIINTRSGVAVKPITGDMMGDIIVGILGMIQSSQGMMAGARDGHGWGGACEFAELGFTFRQIAAETPDMFPVGSRQQLYCTESVLTFEQVFNATSESKWDDLEDSVLHTGNVCNFECTVTHRNGTQEMRSYPIACAAEGLASPRWTFTAEKDRQRKRMCPKVT